MSKKIFDIVPPGRVGKEDEPEEKYEAPVKTAEADQVLDVEPVPQEKSFKFKWVLGPVAFALVIFAGFKISKAEIRIWPRTESVEYSTDVSVDKNADRVDLSFGAVPAKIIEKEKVLFEEFESTGKVVKKAEGTITLYNAYTTSNETWLQGTRFLSAEGKLFKSKDKIHVPGAKLEGGKLVASSVDVPVIAAEAGEDYNIEPTHFSIYVFRGTTKYTKYYGESTEAMAGGGESPQVTAKDLENAEAVLVEKTESACQSELVSSFSETDMFLEDAVKTEVLEKFSVTKAGDEADKFSFRVKVSCSSLVFKKQDIKDFVTEYIIAQNSTKDVYEQSLKVSYSAKSIDMDEGKAVVSLDISADIYEKIDADILKGELIGKSLLGTKFFLENQPEISKAEVEFWPFWVRNVPKNAEKIKVDYNFTPASD